VRHQKYQKIDLDKDYPCPCRRRGRLQPIVLTEALGCDRCQQIFVVQDNGHVIEQLSSTYPYKKAWRWTGNRWIAAAENFGDNYVPVMLVLILLIIMVSFILTFRTSLGLSMAFWLALVILPTLIFWLAYRR
jgi:ribose/xylose/arabinose/galactoside ABC-type transport system permease subunit